MSGAGAHVEVRGAGVRVGGVRSLGPVNLTIGAGERWALLGPNGSGKTTLLSLIGARRQPSDGQVMVLGTTLGHGDVRRLHGRISHVSHLLTERMPADLTAESIVLTGKRETLVVWFQDFDDADRRRAGELLDRFGCAHLRGRTFSTASQGERQRVLLARALFSAPEMMILYEPASGLELPARDATRAARRPFVRRDGFSVRSAGRGRPSRLSEGRSSCARRTGRPITTWAPSTWTPAARPRTEAEFGRVIVLTPDNPRAYTNAGAACFREGRLEDAEILFRCSAEIRPTGPVAVAGGAVTGRR